MSIGTVSTGMYTLVRGSALTDSLHLSYCHKTVFGSEKENSPVERRHGHVRALRAEKKRKKVQEPTGDV